MPDTDKKLLDLWLNDHIVYWKRCFSTSYGKLNTALE